MSEPPGLRSVYQIPTLQFSYYPQTLQGADILAKTLGAQVFMPDFFGEGNEYPLERFPSKTEEDKKYFREFFAGLANIPINATKLVNFANVLKGEGFKKVGALGYCFGNVLSAVRPFESQSLSLLRTFRRKGCHRGCIDGGLSPRCHFERSSFVCLH